jgi:GTPase Era involved in 16S rRNA processing
MNKLISIIFVLFYIHIESLVKCDYNVEDDNKGIFLLVGPTRSGKSCFINTISGKKFAMVGDDAGESTTKTGHIFESRIDGFDEKKQYHLVDTMGLDDTQESQLADHIIIANTTLFIRDLLEEKKLPLDAILIFESLTNDSNQLEKTLKKLMTVFDNINERSIIVFNKNPKPHPNRLKKLVETAQRNGNLPYIHWKSGCGNLDDSYYDQMIDLKENISKIKKLTLDEISNIIKTLIKEGKDIYHRDEKRVHLKIKGLLSIGGTALLALQALNLPSYFIYGTAVWASEEIFKYFSLNEILHITLAIEERVKNKFNNDK